MKLQAGTIFPITRYSLKCVFRNVSLLLVQRKNTRHNKRQTLAVDVGANNNRIKIVLFLNILYINQFSFTQ